MTSSGIVKLNPVAGERFRSAWSAVTTLTGMPSSLDAVGEVEVQPSSVTGSQYGRRERTPILYCRRSAPSVEGQQGSEPVLAARRRPSGR